MNKKTNFSDLERLPPHNHLKHFLNWLWNKPRWILEKFLNKNQEFEVLKMNIVIKEMELTVLKNEIKELRNNQQKR